MQAYQVYDGFCRVGQPFYYKSEAKIFAKLKGYNKDVIPVRVQTSEMFRDGNNIYILMPSGKYDKVGCYYPGDNLRI